MRCPSFTANVTPDAIADIGEAMVLDVSGEPYQLTSPLDREWRALEAQSRGDSERPEGSDPQLAEADEFRL